MASFTLGRAAFCGAARLWDAEAIVIRVRSIWCPSPDAQQSRAQESPEANGGIAYTLGVVLRLIPDTRLQGFSSQLLSFFRAVPKLPRW